jgi:hypothetical protein
MSLKVELFKSLVNPLLREIGERTGKVISNKVFGKEDKDEKKKEEEDKKDEPKDKPDTEKTPPKDGGT